MTVTRRATLQGLGAMGLAGAAGVAPVRAQAKFPSRKINVLIPTGQGGGAERLARAFDSVWSKLLGQPFEYEFQPAAAGQVGYTLYVQKRERDGHNLLFGNMGPEMIMYALQKPAYKFPDDYIYFCSTDVDDSCVLVRRQSPFKTIGEVVEAAKKRPLNTGTSRIPHPASIGILELGRQTGSKFNLIPFQGGNPTQVAVLSGEVDIGVLPIAGVVNMKEQFRCLGVFNKTNLVAQYTDNAPSINAALGTKVPDLYSSRAWAIHTQWAEKNPAAFEILESTAAKVMTDGGFLEAAKKAGESVELMKFGDRKSCTEYALRMVDLANEYRSILSARKG